ncbi:hypothetical protein [Streptomyces sp. TRM64462]|uniref:hypothetical protein n=1 Tax=Streptomyces sp. TRM64462 TaxID=2741726 RepID=UPI0015867E84|nr:hypothetical protein [Streptomyces sp. TRM64462]
MSAHLKRFEPLSTELCGARRSGWERSAPGRHRLPCVLPAGHEGEHRDAFAQTWADSVETQREETGPSVRAGRKPVRMCVRCQHITDTPMVVCEIHSATGPGFNVYCCPQCAQYYFAHPERQPGWPGNEDGTL